MNLEQAFKSVSKVLFGEEIGELGEFGAYLNEMVHPYVTRKSFISGKEVMVALPYYPEDTKFISQEEINKVRFEPLNVNEIKDMDSLVEAIGERVVYRERHLKRRLKLFEEVALALDIRPHFARFALSVDRAAVVKTLDLYEMCDSNLAERITALQEKKQGVTR